MKTCAKCGVTLEAECFYPNDKKCKDCRLEIHREWYYRKKAEDPDWIVNCHLKKKRGLTLASRDEMYDASGMVCPICGKALVKPERNSSTRRGLPHNTAVIDHCHITSANRGVLCSTCNMGIGNLGDSIPILLKAVAYLSKHESLNFESSG